MSADISLPAHLLWVLASLSFSVGVLLGWLAGEEHRNP